MRCRTKSSCAGYVVFHWILPFYEIEDFCNVHTKIVHETYFMLKVRTYSIPIYDYFVSLYTLYSSSNITSSNVHMNYFCDPLFEVKTDNT